MDMPQCHFKLMQMALLLTNMDTEFGEIFFMSSLFAHVPE